MVDIATDSDTSPDVTYAVLPLWYKILVCLGSGMIGGYFGAFYGLEGIVFSAVGGVGVAVFWLHRVSRFQTQSVVAAILVGIGWGMVAGLMDTVWLHAIGLSIGSNSIMDSLCIDLGIVFMIAFLDAVIAGGLYGLLCMIVLEVYFAEKRRNKARMVDITTDSNDSSGADRTALPLWYKILVCLGSAGVGGYFGASHQVAGILFGAVGGVGVAVFWLFWMGKLQTRSVGLRFFSGIGIGILAGVIDTFWLHLTAWGLGYDTLGSGYFKITLYDALLVGSIIAVVAGGLYGLVCTIVLEVRRGYLQEEA
ncbi:MAG: hypothetical protein QGG42_14150 [Phycisphaerae bacterium]|jgi:hypothetical protein|nr:hypothetical protein [Phycisphaerae bacterium]